VGLSLIVRCLGRSFAKPPKAVQTVCECIAILRGLKEISWKSAKGMMSDPNFLRQLKEMDVDNIGTKQTSAVKGKTHPCTQPNPFFKALCVVAEPCS